MTVEELKTELEKAIKELTSSGFGSIDAITVENLEKSSLAASELELKEGRHLIENLLNAIKAIQEGKSKAESGTLRLTALEFYLKKLSGSENTEDL